MGAVLSAEEQPWIPGEQLRQLRTHPAEGHPVTCSRRAPVRGSGVFSACSRQRGRSRAGPRSTYTPWCPPRVWASTTRNPVRFLTQPRQGSQGPSCHRGQGARRPRPERSTSCLPCWGLRAAHPRAGGWVQPLVSRAPGSRQGRAHLPQQGHRLLGPGGDVLDAHGAEELHQGLHGVARVDVIGPLGARTALHQGPL